MKFLSQKLLFSREIYKSSTKYIASYVLYVADLFQRLISRDYKTSISAGMFFKSPHLQTVSCKSPHD